MPYIVSTNSMIGLMNGNSSDHAYYNYNTLSQIDYNLLLFSYNNSYNQIANQDNISNTAIGQKVWFMLNKTDDSNLSEMMHVNKLNSNHSSNNWIEFVPLYYHTGLDLNYYRPYYSLMQYK